VLTVRYERLGLRPGDRVLDLGCGFGRHAFGAARLGAYAVAVDRGDVELKEVRNTFEAMVDVGELAAADAGAGVQADAVSLPFADASFDRIIAAEVLEHIDDDDGALRELARVLRPGGTIAVTVPSFGPERLCWALSADYHAPRVPGGHVRIYRERELRAKLNAAGVRPGFSHRAHALHSPYWWLRCAVGPTNEDHRAVVAYRRFLEWDITARPTAIRWVDRALNPMLGKSLVVYGTRTA
jgi:SAM-dependent methyltransferase